MAKYLDNNGLLYFWQKIKNLFALKTSVVTQVTRSGTTFTAKNSDGTQLFTFSQKDDTVSKTSTTPKMDGTAAIGSETAYAAGDHVHPSDTSRAPTSHASSATTYGAGSSSNYGHVKLSDSTSSTSSTSSGVAATPKAVKDALQIAEEYAYSQAVAQRAPGFSVIVSGSDHVDASSPADTLELIAGANIALTLDGSNKTITLAATDTTYTAMTASEAQTGTGTTERSITPKVLADEIDRRVAAASAGATAFKGTVNAATDISGLTSYTAGWYWVVGTAGTYAGQACEVGDMIFAIANRGSSTSNSDFDVIQNNLITITNSEIDTVLAS